MSPSPARPCPVVGATCSPRGDRALPTPPRSWVLCEHGDFRGRQWLLDCTEITNWLTYSGLQHVGSLYPIRQVGAAMAREKVLAPSGLSPNALEQKALVELGSCQW